MSNLKEINIENNVGLAIGLGIFRKMLNEKIISTKEYENMTKEFTKGMTTKN